MAKKETTNKIETKTVKPTTKKTATKKASESKTAPKKETGITLDAVKKINKYHFQMPNDFRGVEKSEIKKVGGNSYLVETSDKHKRYIVYTLLENGTLSMPIKYNTRESLDRFLKM